MVFSILALVSYVSHTMTLEPGDLIATGTPAGGGPARARRRGRSRDPLGWACCGILSWRRNDDAGGPRPAGGSTPARARASCRRRLPSSQHAAVSQVLGTHPSDDRLQTGRVPRGAGAVRKGRSRAVGQGCGCPGRRHRPPRFALSRDMAIGGQPARSGEIQHLGDCRPRRMDADLQPGGRTCSTSPIPARARDALRLKVKPQAGPFLESLAFLFSCRRRGTGAPEPALGRDDRAGSRSAVK